MKTKDPIIETTDDLEDVLSRISFKNTILDFKWKFEYKFMFSVPTEVNSNNNSGWLLWCSFERPDTLTGKIGRGRGRDEIIWKGSSLSSVVKTAWLLVKILIDHEMLEGFRFDGERIFNPHNSVLDLVDLQKERHNDT